MGLLTIEGSHAMPLPCFESLHTVTSPEHNIDNQCLAIKYSESRKVMPLRFDIFLNLDMVFVSLYRNTPWLPKTIAHIRVSSEAFMKTDHIFILAFLIA